MIINHNMGAINANRMMNINSNAANKSMQKLSSGLRINSAADDAAGLAISEKMRGQIRGLDQASANAQDGISLLQTAEGALNETTSMLQRMRELVVQGNNGTNTQDDRAKIQEEIKALNLEITAVADRTQFNKQNLLNGTFGAKVAGAGSNVDGSTLFEVINNGAKVADDYTVTTDDGTNDTITLTNATTGVTQVITASDIEALSEGDTFNFDKLGITLKATADGDYKSIAANNTFDITGTNVDLQVGANNGQQMTISINNMEATSLGTSSLKVNDIDISVADWDSTKFDDSIDSIDEAIKQVTEERSKLGAWQNRLEHTINNLGTSSENLTTAESRIRDVDMAKEMSTFSKNNILSQAAQAMLAQANQQPQQVLQLLR